MKLNEFLEELTEIFEVDFTVNLDTSLENMAEYDSLAIMSLIAFFYEHFEIEVSGEQLVGVKRVSDLIILIGDDKLS
jgi:acyl carrier protein